MPQIPGNAREVVDRYLELVDEALPRRIEGLHLVGSLALGDYREGQSDIDFVAVTESALSTEELDRLEAVHEALLADGGGAWFGGLYVVRSELAHNPEDILDAPHAHDGRFQRSRSLEINPVTWRVLGTHPFAIRGEPPTVWHDSHVFRTWTLNNLNSYWVDMAAQIESAAPPLAEEAAARAVVWCVSGVLRAAYTLATGAVTSKSGACRYGLTVFPERWHPVISDALATRSGLRTHPTSPSPLEETAAFMRHLIETENARSSR